MQTATATPTGKKTRADQITYAKSEYFVATCYQHTQGQILCSEAAWVNQKLREANGNQPSPLTDAEITAHGISDVAP